MKTERCPKCEGLGYVAFQGSCHWCNRGKVPARRVLRPGMWDIHNGIKAWHEGDSGAELHEHLGLTWLEYRVWVNYRRLPEHSNWYDPSSEGVLPCEETSVHG